MRTFSIILADDEQNILFGMQKGINWEELGFIVAGTAQNGKEVLEMMDDLHPDLVISDIKMPFMDGLELAKTIHDNYMNTKVILFSGWDDFEYARLAISYGVSEYLMKPIDYDEMKKLLIDMHQALEEEYNEKINWTRLENAYFKSLPLLRQQFFTQLVLGTMELEECHQQIKNLGLELDNKQYCIIAVKIQKVDHKDVFSALSIKETLKEALDKISNVYEEEDTIKIDVADNGLGMTEDKLEYIMNHQVVSSKRGSGIGVRNVHERIQLIYGKQYGITITSELDEGTTATITIPKMEEADETE